ncbi:hypothetical protein SprV_0100241400 [Sparganum proliferum]
MSNGRRKNSHTPNIADTRTKKTGIISTDENSSTPSQVKSTCTRPRELRSSNKDECSSFSRASAARRSLGCTSQTWLDAVDELEAKYATSRPLSFVYDSESNSQLASYFSGPNKNHKVTSVAFRDLKYDQDALKLAKSICVNGPFDLNTYGFALDPVFDKSIRRWWAAQIKRLDGAESANSSEVSLREGDFIVKVNGKDARRKSSESLISSITDALLTPGTVVLSILRPSDIPKTLADFRNTAESGDKDSARQKVRSPSVSPMTPKTCIKNLYAFNTRSIGQKLAVELVKSAEGGFGISFATRDTMVSPTTDEPIFIDRIMPTGSAVQDGRLQFGDRLLAINNVEVSSFESALSQLRNIPVGKKATLLVSRQSEVLTNCLGGAASSESTTDDVPVCRTYTFKIPVPPPEAANSSIGIRFAFSEQPLMLHSPTEAELSLCEPGAMIGEVFPIDEQENNAAAQTQDLSGLYVQLIKPNSPADNGDASVRVGDRLVAVNGHNVVGRSLSEVADLLTSTIAACRAKSHKHRPTIKFTVNRFFQRKTQSERLARERNRDARPEATQSGKTKGHSTSSVPQSPKTPKKKTTVTIAERESERSSRPNGSTSHRTVDGQEKHNRSASVEPRGRSRKQTVDDSPVSPKRATSTFAREAIGRRSVSEKRHANMNATSFKFFNENVLPLRFADEHTSRLYSTMPSVRGVRQLRRAKQGRSSGPVKPVHGKDPIPTPPRAASRSLASSPDVLRTDVSQPTGSAFPRPITGRHAEDIPYEVTADNSSESYFERSVSYNQSLCNAVDTPNTPEKPQVPLPLEASKCAPGPPVLPSRFRPLLSSAGDTSSASSSSISAVSNSVPPQNSVDYVATLPRKSAKHRTSMRSTSPPPVPTRRTKAPTVTTASPTTDISPDYQMSLDRHLLSRGLSRVGCTKRDLTSSAMQHQKIIQDFMKHHRSGKRDKYSLLSDQAPSVAAIPSRSSHLVALKKVTSIPRPTSPPLNIVSSRANPQSLSPKPTPQVDSSAARVQTSPIPPPIQLFNAYVSPASAAPTKLHKQTNEAPHTILSSFSQPYSTLPVNQESTSSPTSPKAEKSDFFSSVAYPKSPKVFNSRQPKSAYLEEVETCLRKKHTSPNRCYALNESPFSSTSSTTTSSSSQTKLQNLRLVDHWQQPADPYFEKPSDTYRRRPLTSRLGHPTEECWLQPEDFPKPATVHPDLKDLVVQGTNERLPMPPPSSPTKIPRRPSSARYIHSPHTVVRSKSPAANRFANYECRPTSRGSFDDAGLHAVRSPGLIALSSIPRGAVSRQLSSPAARFEADYSGHCSRPSPTPPQYSRDYIFKERTSSRPHVPQLPVARNATYSAQTRSSRTPENWPRNAKQSARLPPTLSHRARPFTHL